MNLLELLRCYVKNTMRKRKERKKLELGMAVAYEKLKGTGGKKRMKTLKINTES